MVLTNKNFIKMEKILNRLLDLPQVVNSKLPGNTFNSWVQDSESNIPSCVVNSTQFLLL